MDKYGYSGRQLAKVAGLELDAINKILRGAHADPSVSKLLAIAQTFNCSLDDLVGHSLFSNASDKEPVDRDCFDFAVKLSFDKRKPDSSSVADICQSVYQMYHMINKLKAEPFKGQDN